MRSRYFVGIDCYSSPFSDAALLRSRGLLIPLPGFFFSFLGESELRLFITIHPKAFSQLIRGAHFASQASPKIISSVILGVTTNRIVSWWSQNFRYTGSIKWEAAKPPTKVPSTCLNFMGCLSFLTHNLSFCTVGWLIRHQVQPESMSAFTPLLAPEREATISTIRSSFPSLLLS